MEHGVDRSFRRGQTTFMASAAPTKHPSTYMNKGPHTAGQKIGMIRICRIVCVATKNRSTYSNRPPSNYTTRTNLPRCPGDFLRLRMGVPKPTRQIAARFLSLQLASRTSAPPRYFSNATKRKYSTRYMSLTDLGPDPPRSSCAMPRPDAWQHSTIVGLLQAHQALARGTPPQPAPPRWR